MGPIIGVLPFRFAAWRRNEKVLSAEKAFWDEGLLQLPWRSFRADVLAWITAGAMMLIIYYGFFLPYASTSIKVLAGCAALGIFSGMLSYLKTEKRLIRMLAAHQQAVLMPKRMLTLSRKIFLLIVTMLGMMAVTVLMMVLLDVYYLLDQDFSRSDVYWGIFKEIAFALVVLLGLSVIIIKRYAANLKQVMGLQLAAMEEISRGNLDRQVPVLTSDEFARFAQKTNEMMIGLQERDYCRSSFEKYVSPEVSRKILKDDIAASGEMIDVTVLFCDLRDYTSFAESRNPHEVVGFLNQYFAVMEPVIRKHGGVVIQFIGDEIEAAFGAPKPLDHHPDKAVKAAWEMQVVLNQLNDERRQKGESVVRHGIGIHSGMVLAGNVGSQARLSYALVGDTVNLASRVQVLNKTCGTDILLTRATRDRLAATKEKVQRVGRFPIKGKSDEVEVFTLTPDDAQPPGAF